MCTVSWCLQQDRMQILFNRDERKSRVVAVWPEHYQQAGVEAIMPIDPEGEGSWLAANDRGMVFCLLNDYVSTYQPTEAIRRSRGHLLRTLAHSPEWQELDVILQPESLLCYAPFRLLVFVGLQEPLLWHWDGQTLRQQCAPHSPLSSSSRWPMLIPELRARYWQRMMAVEPSAENQLLLHQQAKPLHASMGIAMQRQQVQTVSITRLQLKPDSICMEYWDGHPTMHQATPDRSLELKLLPRLEQAEDRFDSQLDVRGLMQRFSPAVSHRLRRWQWSLLRWLLAEKPLNQGLQWLNQQPAERFCDIAIQRLGLQPRVVACRWPASASRPVFVCNHPTGGIDGLVLISLLQKRYPDLKVIANEVLMEVHQLTDRIVPVSVFGNARASLPVVQTAFASDAPLLIFPAGRTARVEPNVGLDDGPWAKLAVTLARREQRSMTVLHLQSRNSRWFYLLARLRRRFGITSNLEMLLLVREMLKPATKQPTLYVDVPMHPVELTALADTDRQRISWLKHRCYQLPRVYQEEPDDTVKPSCSRRAN
ncbi:NRDE family protein [Alkalimonas collagenimarina]|uniref:NRDE family protein n=1 Tax=Alkalimonas collagenimarina TaxID=400390 RepID=A0ABT9GYK6_9GAMM|nr:NRDE family protein [Alkalimonas collagenimarina]MDP4536145.1 NRDE family protein [Alkalimonas collagenimarina]